MSLVLYLPHNRLVRRGGHCTCGLGGQCRKRRCPRARPRWCSPAADDARHRIIQPLMGNIRRHGLEGIDPSSYSHE